MSRCGRDRGASTVETSLLMVAIAIALVPVAFGLGVVLRSNVHDSCDKIATVDAGASCSAASSGSGAAAGGGAGLPGPVGQSLDAAVAAQVAGRDPARGEPDVRCDSLPSDPPPTGTRTTCMLRYPDGSTDTVTVVFTDASGSFTVGS
jgi:Flp pilus assembly pilin Flp